MTKPNIIRLWKPIAIASVLALGACTNPPSATTIATGTTAVLTLADIAATNNSTVAGLLNKGALICGEASSTVGQLVTGTAIAVANSAGVPVSVTGQLSTDVAAMCKAAGSNLVPGPAPAAQTTIPVATVPVLPVVASAS